MVRTGQFFADKTTPWPERLAFIVDTMRELSRQTDPQEMSRYYSRRMRQIWPTDRFLAISRRGLTAPRYRITRCSLWQTEVNPWAEPERLPLLKGGLLAELLYGDEPRVIDRLEVASDDPAAEYLQGMGSLVAVPHYDQGAALNMIVLMREPPAAFPHQELPELVWLSNLFGRITLNLVMAEQVKAAYEQIDHELKTVANIQRSLLPQALPTIPTLRLAAHYQTARRAGGDYYDFFPLPEGRWGILVADVSGHGTPAAVMMAVTHSLAHTLPGPAEPPGQLLGHVNDHLARRYTADSGTFVTAFYGVYDPATRRLTYSSAGHPPPRLMRCDDGSTQLLDGVLRLPLGILPGETFTEAVVQLQPGDQLLFFTDGITEAKNSSGDQFGRHRLDRVLSSCGLDVDRLLEAVLAELEAFTGGAPPDDDRTLLAAKVV